VTHEEYIAERAHRTVRLRDGKIESDVPSGSSGNGRGVVPFSAAADVDARAEVLAG
jgi:ABC-type lipoprotein export system ATPase subunit